MTNLFQEAYDRVREEDDRRAAADAEKARLERERSERARQLLDATRDRLNTVTPAFEFRPAHPRRDARANRAPKGWLLGRALTYMNGRATDVELLALTEDAALIVLNRKLTAYREVDRARIGPDTAFDYWPVMAPDIVTRIPAVPPLPLDELLVRAVMTHERPDFTVDWYDLGKRR